MLLLICRKHLEKSYYLMKTRKWPPSEVLWSRCWQGKLRGKKLQSLIDKISPQTDLGPFSGGSYTGASGISVNLELIPLSRLQSGANSERVVLGRAVCSVSVESAITLYVIPFLFSSVLSLLDRRRRRRTLFRVDVGPFRGSSFPVV